MEVRNKEGKLLMHPDDAKDYMNDSMHSAIEQMNYELYYDECRARDMNVIYQVVK